MEHTFLAMWCSEGLECIIDITAHEQKQLWETLKGGEVKALPNLNAMMLRARYNSQRRYEIYIVGAVEGITEQDLRSMFDNDPQYAADLIRERGTQLYSDRAVGKKEKII
jgi:hypothetical protein